MMLTYSKLAAKFDKHHKDPRGLDYLTGEQVVSRLNEVLGPGAWSFSVKEHGYDTESDEIWALGHLDAAIDGIHAIREQFGSQKHNRRKTQNGLNGPGAILDYGFDLKGASTDALKKCATLLGVGLYLAEKDGGIPQDLPAARPVPFVPTRERDVEDTFVCEECSHPILAQSGEMINAGQASTIRERYGRLICREHRPKAKVSA